VRTLFLATLLLGFAASLVGLGALVHHVYFDRDELPVLEPFIRFDLPTVGRVYDANGEVLLELAREYRRVLSYDELPAVVRDAILSAEDKNFFSHPGVDYSVFARVLWRNVARSLNASGSAAGPRRGLWFSQGGSTITQQIVRRHFLPHLTSREGRDTLTGNGFLPRLAVYAVGASATNKLVRKLEEIRLSLWLEEELQRHFGSQRRAKQEILARYASLFYMGRGRYGFAAASQYYFDKPLSSYSVDDADKAAVLAGILKCPRDCAPTPRNSERVLRRRNAILDLMAKNRQLTPEQARLALQAPLRLALQPERTTGPPAVIETVLSELKRLGNDRLSFEQLVRGRILVHATADGEIQALADAALETGLQRFEERHPESIGLIQGAVVVLGNADARILAETGGRQSYRDRSSSYVDFNRASDSRRQAGSAMKPFVYLAAFRLGASLDHEVPDQPIGVPAGDGQVKWIRNYDRRFEGVISVRQALAESRNAAATWIAQGIGIRDVVRTAEQLGIAAPPNAYISFALGASEVRLVELANAYRAMASGVAAEPHMIQRVSDASGSILFVANGDARPLAIDPLALWEIQEGLRGVIRIPRGTAHSLERGDFPIPVMGKTGTSSDFRDALFVGSTYGPQGITVAVRIGYDDNRGLGKRETGARAALPIFKEIMLGVYERQLAGPVPSFPQEMEQHITDYIVCAAAASGGAIGDAPDVIAPRTPLGGLDVVKFFADDELPWKDRPVSDRCGGRGLALNQPLSLAGDL
jgi:penicillin-binding protein 1A